MGMHSLIETGSVQEIQTIKDYLEQLKTDIRGGASSYVQDSVSMMEELTTAIKKSENESTVDRVNSKAESKLLAVKVIEELIGFGGTHENFVEQSVEQDKEESVPQSDPKKLKKHQQRKKIKLFIQKLQILPLRMNFWNLNKN